jgi:hypothetical protein
LSNDSPVTPKLAKRTHANTGTTHLSPQACRRKHFIDLVEHFQRNEDAYHSGAYNEAQLRREFLDPFFGALGWDVGNRMGAAESPLICRIR